MDPRLVRGALAGVSGIAAWTAAMAIDRRLTGSSYDDIELLGKAFTRGRAWLPLGLLMHTVNGAAFGALYARYAEARLPGPPWARGLLLAQLENATLSTLTPLVDRVHPAIREGRTGRLATIPALALAVWRHAVFGATLGAVYGELRRG